MFSKQRWLSQLRIRNREGRVGTRMEKTEREHKPERKQGEAKLKQGEAKLLKYWRQGQV